MKLSQMNTEELAEALCRLAGPLCRIGRDGQVSAALARLDGKGPMGIRLCDTLEKLIPLLMDKHLDDGAEILSILTGKEKEAILGQSALSTLRDVRACADEELLCFFGSPGRTRKAGSWRPFIGTARRGGQRSWQRFWRPSGMKRRGGAASWPD